MLSDRLVDGLKKSATARSNGASRAILLGLAGSEPSGEGYWQ